MMNVGRLINHSPARYLAGHRALWAPLEISEVDSFYQFISSNIPDYPLCESDVRVLGIGSGSGEADSVILKKLLQRHSSVYNRVVEPSEEMVQRYKALVRDDRSLGNVKFDWRHQTAEEYFEGKESTKFHLVHALQVLYHVEDHDATLRNMWEQLADGGYMLVAQQSGKGDLGGLWSKLWEEFGQGDRLNTSLRTTRDVRRWLDAMDISYVTSEVDFNMDVTECFKEDSKAGPLILDFLTQTPYVSDVPEIRFRALEYIRCNSTMVGEKMFLKSINEVIVAKK